MRSTHSAIGELSEETRAMKVWRYFDLPKFISLLQHGGLYFCRADLLGDRFEGSVTRAKQKNIEAIIARCPEGDEREKMRTEVLRSSSFFSNLRMTMYVNCWHLGDHESMAMWKGYGAGSHGVAISSNVSRLEDLIPEHYDSKYQATNIYIGKVKYVDLTSEVIQIPNTNNVYGPLICKSIVHEHERELRAIFWYPQAATAGRLIESGHFVPVDLKKLIERVIVSPLAEDWFRTLICDLCKRYGFDFEVIDSVMATEPVF
jgi:hypothetical protein